MTRHDEDREKIARVRHNLIEWYERNKRDLPWRARKDPYAIWVSEIMLQQTRVAVVIDRYQAFMKRFPTLLSLALAQEQDVLAMWSGLGYYRRARMLHKAAQFVANNHEGNLPANAEGLRALPGIGSYTAAAIASIAFAEPVAVVDGNVERVLCRVAGWDAAGRSAASSARRKVEELAARLVDPELPGDFNQAMMELGATVCLPKNPQCLVCPIASECKTRGEHKTSPRPRMLSREIAHALSIRTAREASKTRAHVNREVLLEQRPSTCTVMPGMWELPVLRSVRVPQKELHMTLRHAIMQVNYYVRIRSVFEDDVEELTALSGKRQWVPLSDASAMALTGLTRKVLLRAHLLPAPVPAAIALQPGADVV